MHTRPTQAFWISKSLQEMTCDEWEALCDGCGRCCLHKLEDDESGEVFYTNVACRLLDLQSCRCMDYTHRFTLIDDCLQINQSNLDNISWLPTTCSYRLLAEGKELPEWHPLITGTDESVVEAGISVKDIAIPESPDIKIEEHILGWTVNSNTQDNK